MNEWMFLYLYTAPERYRSTLRYFAGVSKVHYNGFWGGWPSNCSLSISRAPKSGTQIPTTLKTNYIPLALIPVNYTNRFEYRSKY